MTERVVRLPDVGEGVAEAELVSWQVAVGDVVHPDSVLAEVLTDKATVEVFSPVAGRVTVLRGTVGEVLAVGSEFVVIETDVDAPATTPAPEAVPAEPSPAIEPDGADPSTGTDAIRDVRTGTADLESPERGAAVAGAGHRSPHHLEPGARPVAAPAVRLQAREAGVDLRLVPGSGPAGRITHADVEAYLDGRATPLGPATNRTPRRATEERPIVGLRRRIADRLALSASRIPHITYVDEVDVGAVDDLRRTLNAAHPDAPKLTLLPFLVRSIVLAVADQPHLNATFDDGAELLTVHGPVHVGIATQTPNGLLVPVVRDADTLDVWRTAAEIARVSEAARAGKATRDELGGSTITITSLGALGGLVTTPIINHPEVAIVGVNKMQVRPMWDGQQFQPRTMMNLSSSFDHRIVDGWDAATFVQRLKALLETPALLFIGEPGTPSTPGTPGTPA